MNAPMIPVRVSAHDPWADVPEYRPIGHDAPKHSLEWTNFEAARVAASEVRGRAIHCPKHAASLAAWMAGERAWPWPDATEADRRLSDGAILELSKGLRKYAREHRRKL